METSKQLETLRAGAGPPASQVGGREPNPKLLLCKGLILAIGARNMTAVISGFDGRQPIRRGKQRLVQTALPSDGGSLPGLTCTLEPRRILALNCPWFRGSAPQQAVSFGIQAFLYVEACRFSAEFSASFN